MTLSGVVDPAYAEVAEAFLRNFTDHGDVGAGFCLYSHGRPVVDVWAGMAEPDGGRAWDRDTIAPIFSISKAATAICALVLIEREELELDAPVARYWPEFARHGKDRVTVRDAMAHRAAVACLDRSLTLDEVLAWDPVVRAIAEQEPNWEPGTGWGYHVRTWGWLVGELVRRVSGRTVGEFLAEVLCRPLGLDLWIGLPAAEDHRVAEVLLDPVPSAFYMPDASLKGRVLSGPSPEFAYPDGALWNASRFHRAEVPSSNGIGDARSVARLLAAVVGEVDGTRLLAPETVAAATAVHSDGLDLVLGRDFYRMGLGLHRAPGIGTQVGPNAFGHLGRNGSLAWADPDRCLAYAYVCNQEILAISPDGHVRSTELTRAAYACAQRE